MLNFKNVVLKFLIKIFKNIFHAKSEEFWITYSKMKLAKKIE